MLWPDAFLSLQTCEKIVLFLNFEMADVSRTFWRRCPTPEGQSSAARREMPAISKFRNSRFLKRSAWKEMHPDANVIKLVFFVKLGD